MCNKNEENVKKVVVLILKGVFFIFLGMKLYFLGNETSGSS